ncbi:MAG: hypothetical protein RBT33_00875 [Candidatus Dojkabacteria bacterium]|jgi:hypothetical protein|nr:hypothetical protein [Candidatus Dojkabacteria bacterium]MDX9738906.1 hypothetical protein [Candidatus Dojkabacteria bacterium]
MSEIKHPLKHQLAKAKELYSMVKTKGYAYLVGAPRSGKTYTALLALELSTAKSVLILCPKAAINGWKAFIDQPYLSKKYTVTNYEQMGSVETTGPKNRQIKIPKLKLNAADYDCIIIDESHNFGIVGKPNGRTLLLKTLCQSLPHIHLSGTPWIETPCSIYYQMNISKYSPFKYKNFYEFFKVYGIPSSIYTAHGIAPCYKKAIPELEIEIAKFCIYMTQEDAGISEDLQAKDVVHYITLNEETKKLYNAAIKKRVIVVQGEEIVLDTKTKERVLLHMLEGGTLKLYNKVFKLGNTEKIDFIKTNFGDTDKIGIMCHFTQERDLLKAHFKYANIYSSVSHAEGVDLSHLEHFIIYSNNYSGVKHVQRRDRIVNINGSASLLVHHLLVAGGISEQVYELVSCKKDFNNEVYKRKLLED